MKSEKEILRQDLIEAENDVDYLENVLWQYSRDPEFEYELDEDETESELNTAQNHYHYLYNEWKEVYGDEEY